ncbi:hypothetical protein QA601_17440 [Chitinispirillales bacterium ANBcel5]|uniref:hypothetical protein n=1 Tax=Cellulosispirillum alkaliphilum TaxID=3039283 RepID=UPI002A5324F5|nr:hypothetical protein [Chitinispirillales bacterium ANBcel5]
MKIIISVLLLASVLSSQTFQATTNVNEPQWRPVMVDSNYIIVEWQEKYGYLRSDTCVGVWESGREYLLTQRDHRRRVVLQKSNIVSISYRPLKYR